MAIKRAPTRPAHLRALEPARPYLQGTDGALQDEGAQVDPAVQVDDLVQRAERGDPDAFAELYERFHTPVFRYLLARVGNRIEAEDMASEVFVEAARRVRSFDGNGAAFAGWLFTIARHDLLDRGRAQRRRVVVPVPDVPDIQVVPDPADRIVDLLDAGRVRDALEGLTEEQRDVLLLKFAGGLTNEEAAESLGKPVGAVKSLQHRGLAALKRALDKASPDGTAPRKAKVKAKSTAKANGKAKSNGKATTKGTATTGATAISKARTTTNGRAKARPKTGANGASRAKAKR